jgi:hypothetical protein
VEALEERLEALVEDLQGRGAKQADDLDKLAHELGGRWTQHFQEQAEAAVAKLREELKNSGRAREESRRQLASLAEAKVASLSQATREEEEYEQQLAQAFREYAQVMHEAADVEVESIKRAAEQAMAQLQVAEQQWETSFMARAGAAEERLTAVSSAVEALVKDFPGQMGDGLQAFQEKGAKQADDLDKLAQELGGRWSQQFQEQAGAAVARLQQEVKNSGRVVEESKRQLANLAEVKLATLSQAAANAAAGLEAGQRRLRNQYETSRIELEELLAKRPTNVSLPSVHCAPPPKRRSIVAKLALVAGLFLVIVASRLGVSLSKVPVMQLRPEAPADFIDQSPNWSAKRRVREIELAQAYWREAAAGLQERYPFGSELPAEPPVEFQIETKYIPAGSAKAFSEARAHYWEKLRRSWVQRESWVERDDGNMQWTDRLRHIWDQLHSHK